ncbi:MAG: polymer-forming cytoskeletal protein [Myxococcota bacterium]|nr:polymer-forming cytoskeletal protein [Myxococcota bacterium]
MATSIVTKDATIQGSIVGKMNLHVAGTVLGSVDIEGLVVVEETALITGDIDADDVWVCGAIEGDIRATSTINLRATARVEGDLISPNVHIEPGASLRLLDSPMEEFVEAETVEPPIVDVVSRKPASILFEEIEPDGRSGKTRRRPVFVRKKRRS